MFEGAQLKMFIDNQTVSKVKIAKDLKMSKQNLYNFFKSKELEPETKVKFEEYFGKSIFTGIHIKTSNQPLPADRPTMNNERIQDLKEQIKELKEDKDFIKKQYQERLDRIETMLINHAFTAEANLNTLMEEQKKIIQLLSRIKKDTHNNVL
jgi:AcrR family transcriptional regulator